MTNWSKAEEMAPWYPSAAVVLLGLLAFGGCSSDPAAPAGTGGQGSGVGGAIGSGGSASGGVSSGGVNATGGSTGGSLSTTGGTLSTTGGTLSTTGGSLSTTGGASSGGSGVSGSGAGGSSSGGSSPGGTSSGGKASGGGGGVAGKNGGGAGGTALTGGNGGSGGAAGASASPAAALDKFRFECPCKPGAADHTSDGNCNVTPATDRQTIVKTMGGDSTKVYDVTFRVRGLTEPNTYRNGMLQGERFYIGGSTSTAGYTSYMMTTADPVQHYFFNYSPTTGHVHFKLDYQVTVKIRGGSQVTFDVDGDGSVPDGHQVSNFDNMVVPDVPPAPMAYDGQFIQLDVVSAVVAP